MKKNVVINGLNIKIVSRKILGGLLSQKVVILDEYNDVHSSEAEHIVKYLYSEGFIEKEEVSLEVVKMLY